MHQYHDTETHRESFAEVRLPYASIADNQQVQQNITEVENSRVKYHIYTNTGYNLARPHFP